MTLREEIHEYVYQHNKDEYGKCHECEYRTEQILKLFEKMIDAKIKETKSLEAYKEAMLNITKYPKTYHECIGRLNGFKDLKEELEK